MLSNPSSENRPLTQLLRALARCLFRVNSQWVLALGWLLYRLEIHGREHLPTKGPLIIVGRANGRVGIFFAAFFFSVLKEFYGLAGGPFIVNSRFVTWLSRELGMFPAFKGASLSAAPLMEARNLLRQGKIIFMTVTKELPWDGRLQPLLPGAGWLAFRTGAPLVAMAVQGDYDIWPRWARRPYLRGKLIVRIGKPFYLSDTPCDGMTQGMLEETSRRLQAELEALSDGYMLRGRKGEGEA